MKKHEKFLLKEKYSLPLRWPNHTVGVITDIWRIIKPDDRRRDLQMQFAFI